MAFGPILRFKVDSLNVELAPLRREDALEFIDLSYGGGLQQQSITRYLAMAWAPTVEDEQDWYEKVRTDKANLTWGIWILEEGSTAPGRTLIGTSSLMRIGSNGHAALLRQSETASVIFRKEYWGHGIASTAHKVRAWYAFRQLGLHRLTSYVYQDNSGSRKAIERSGYVLTHTKRNDQFYDGEFHHIDAFECLNPDNLFWDQWWHGETPPESSQQARKTTINALQWAEKNVEIA